MLALYWMASTTMTPAEENGLVSLIIVAEAGAGMRAIPEWFGENGGFLTKEQADQGVGRGPRCPPHR